MPTGALVAVNRTEHPCVLEAAKFFFGERVVWLEVDRHGVIAMGPLEKLLASKAIGAVVIMAANNETGVLQPWRELAWLCRRHHAAFFCDASQWLGKLPAAGLGEADWVIGSAHKFGGPKGVGFVLAAEGAQMIAEPFAARVEIDGEAGFAPSGDPEIDQRRQIGLDKVA